MRTIHYVFILFLIASVILVRYDLSRRIDIANVNRSNEIVAELPTAEVANNSTVGLAPPQTINEISKKNPKLFIDQFKTESAQISKIQNNPEMVQNRMKKLAEVMTPQDVNELYDIISDENKDGDQRALAVELLSMKNDTASLIVLQNFVANSTTVNGTKWDRKKELETVLRAQAVESIAAYPQKDIALSTLSYLQHKVDERFLVDRIGRAAANLNNKAPSLQQQDEAALKNLIE